MHRAVPVNGIRRGSTVQSTGMYNLRAFVHSRREGMYNLWEWLHNPQVGLHEGLHNPRGWTIALSMGRHHQWVCTNYGHAPFTGMHHLRVAPSMGIIYCTIHGHHLRAAPSMGIYCTIYGYHLLRHLWASSILNRPTVLNLTPGLYEIPVLHRHQLFIDTSPSSRHIGAACRCSPVRHNPACHRHCP